MPRREVHQETFSWHQKTFLSGAMADRLLFETPSHTEKNGSARITHKLIKKGHITWLANFTSRLVFVTSTLRIY